VLPGYQKNKKPLTVPISDELAGKLKEFLAHRLPTESIWGSTMPRYAAIMIRADFRQCGIEFPDDGKHRDFHALRHTAITSWLDAGADLKTAQELAGHSVITLTAGYAHPTQDAKRSIMNSITLPAAKPTA